MIHFVLAYSRQGKVRISKVRDAKQAMEENKERMMGDARCQRRKNRKKEERRNEERETSPHETGQGTCRTKRNVKETL